MQGPAELLPVSSSGHLALVPRLLGWSYAELPADLRKSFEVALHAGSAPALLLAARGELRRDPQLLALTVVPPALAGLAFERAVQERWGGTRSVAIAQVAAGAALLMADASEGRRESATALDHLAVGVAQAIALVPGVSRFGAALTAARLRGVSRAAAVRLSLRAAVPVTMAAGALKGVRMAARPSPLPEGLTAGAAAALVSSLAALPLLDLLWRRHALRALACYRIALGVGVLLHARRAPQAVGRLSTAMRN
jgi:undecaprenyl-diphosphatase